MMDEAFSPKEFLKARHPERFSDSRVEAVSETDRSLLEYHLDSITSRSQETEFERFCRAIIKLEVCPNLLPQTGPTGGGDSKVDSETYPVADQLALSWHVGIGREAASERWAFAFSAKKQWKPKLQSDIAKIEATDRGYKKAFFITNQSVRDKARAELEDELTKKHGLDVRILDRTWILDIVFEHDHQDIAIDELQVSSSIRKHIYKGPIDLHRESELAELEEKITTSLATDQPNFAIVDKCIDAAILSRELERPKTETIGRFERADTLALRVGTRHQKVQVAYHRAWTSMFWFEDLDAFSALYSVVESRTEGTTNIFHLELLCTLWKLLGSHAQDRAKFDCHTKVLRGRLNEFVVSSEKPSAALQARTLLLMVDLQEAFVAGESIAPVLGNFSKIIKETETLIGFPIRSLVDCLLVLGEFLSSEPAYDSLHNELVEVVTRRDGEISGARLLVNLGERKLDEDRPVDTIRVLGGALHRLAKEESQPEFCRALYVCACAYERIGLLWAARGTFLMAAATSMSSLFKFDEVTPFQAACIRRLKWIELQLGRLPYLFSFHEFDMILREILATKGYDRSQLSKGDQEFDFALGILFLKAEFWDLKHLKRVPDQLSSLALNNSSMALLHSLGHESEYLPDDIPDSEDSEQDTLFSRWRDIPGSEDLPSVLNLCNQSKIVLTARALGCDFEFTAPNRTPFIELAESLLSALEATLSTGITRRLLSSEPRFSVIIRRSEFCSQPLEFSVDESGDAPCLSISCRDFDCDSLSRDEQAYFQDQLISMLSHIVARIVVGDDDEIEALLKDDVAVSRSVNFTSSLMTLGNILGSDRKYHTSDCLNTRFNEYHINRSKPWDSDCPAEPPERRQIQFSEREIDGEMRSALIESQGTKHSDIHTVSLIRVPLWNRAKWGGCGYVTFPDTLPVLALIFENAHAARQIFEHWRKELGKQDSENRLRVSVIRKVSKNLPHHYRIVFGSNMEGMEVSARASQIRVIQRIHTMEPDSSENLDRFLEAYAGTGAYYLAPTTFVDGDEFPQPVGEVGEFWLTKSDLVVRDAWEVGLNDPDRAGVFPEDDPCIPDSASSAPVRHLLEQKSPGPARETRRPREPRRLVEPNESTKDRRQRKKKTSKQSRRSRGKR